MEKLPFPDEIILNILSNLNIFDLATCARTSKQLMIICKDKKFQQYLELKKTFKNSTLNLSANDFLIVNITNQECINGFREALKQKGKKIKVLMDEQKFEDGSRLFTVYEVSSFKAGAIQLLRGQEEGERGSAKNPHLSTQVECIFSIENIENWWF